MADDDLSLDGIFSEKAQLDTEELSVPGGAAQSASDDKVELDLEDAPFLDDDDEDETPPPPQPSTSGPVLLEPSEAPKSNIIKQLLGNKKILISLLAVVALLIGLMAWLVLKPAPRPEIPPAPIQKTVQADQPEPETPKPQGFVVTWEPFWVEQKDKEGHIRFLVCKFSAPTDNEKLSWEAGSKKTVLRDAIFYYLRNKDLIFLSDSKNVDVLKADLLAVINQYMNNGQFEDVLIENYLVK